jgi:MFS family permease
MVGAGRLRRVTDLDTERGRRRADGDRGSRRIATSRYLEIFRIPGARRFSAAGFVGRMPMSMVGLGVILVVSAATGKYAIAGAVAAVGSLCYAFVAPLTARLIDRAGQGRVLPTLTAVFAVGAVAFIACAQARAPLWTLFVTGAIFMSAMPSLGTMVRSRWSFLLGDSPLLHTAFSFESVADEMIFVTGPALVTLLATQVLPVAGIAVAAVLAVAGTLLLAGQRGTEPPASPRQRGDGRAITTAGMPVIMVIFVALGAMFGTIDLSTVAFAAESHDKPLAGLILGTYALGSATGGLWYGGRRWRAPLHRRFLITLAGMIAGVAPMWALPSVPVLFGVIFFCGLAIAPTLIAGFSLIERTMPRGLLTEGMALLSTAIGVGLALGPPVAGRLIDARNAHWGYAFALACGTVALTAGLLGARRLRGDESGGTRQSQ